MPDDYVITFSSTHQTLQAKKQFSRLQLDYELIATPREISSECGFCIILYKQELNAIKILRQQIPEMEIYLKILKKGKTIYEKIS
jgi:hypothetical protein